MSKMDDMRAMREARYERTAAAPPVRAGGPARKVAPAVAPAAARRPAPAPALTEDRLCGHSSIGGSTCTRDAGHAAKSHRYS